MVGNVAGVVADALRGGMGENDRGFALLQRVLHGPLGRVAEVHHHPDAVHFSDHPLLDLKRR